jgi:hypothetical protein
MFTRRRAGRGRGRKLNPLSILALVLLIALFLARRLTSNAPHMTAGAGAPSQAIPVNGSGEKLTPADRRSLDQVIHDKAHP